MKIGVVGIGALGCLLGAYLGDVGDLTLYGHWPEQIAAIRQTGLWLQHPDGSRTHHRPAITDNPAEVGPVDVALVVVKSRQTGEAAATVARILKPGGLTVTLQNGLNNCAALRDNLGESRVTQAVTSQGATVLGVGHVRHAGHGPTYFGRDADLGLEQRMRLPEVVELFNTAGLQSHLVENIDGLIWGKLAVNAAINPLTALLRMPNGFLAEHESLVDIMKKAANEVAEVAHAQDITLPFSDAAEQALIVARATAANRSSMLQDVDRGVPTEVEAICGAVARVARTFGVSTPINIRLCRLVRKIEGGQHPLIEPGDVDGLLRIFADDSIR